VSRISGIASRPLERGAKADLPDPEGVTPLIASIFNAHLDVAKFLIEKNANVHRWDWWGRSPLYLAVDYNTLPHGGRPDQPSLDETLPIDIIRMLQDELHESQPCIFHVRETSRRHSLAAQLRTPGRSPPEQIPPSAPRQRRRTSVFSAKGSNGRRRSER
jgi:hypothetical protein